MLKVKDIMRSDVITVTPETEIIQVANLLLEHRINGVPVVDSSGKLVGILCQSDLIAQQKRIPLPSLFTLLDGYISLGSKKRLDQEIRKIAAITVDQAMTRNPVTVQPDMGIEVVADLMADRKFYTIPVVDKGRLVGVVGKEDILRTLLGDRKEQAPSG